MWKKKCQPGSIRFGFFFFRINEVIRKFEEIDWSLLPWIIIATLMWVLRVLKTNHFNAGDFQARLSVKKKITNGQIRGGESYLDPGNEI